MTLFEKIMAGQIPAEFLHQDEFCVAIRDINPQAPVHLLIIPRHPLPRLGEARPEDAALLGHLLVVAGELARQTGIEASGYRVVINHGRDGGETVPHLHVHLLGRRPLHWPPG